MVKIAAERLAGVMGVAMAVAGCNDAAGTASASATASATAVKSAPPAAAAKSSAAPTPPANDKKTCADFGGTGEGTLDEPCKVKSAPISIKALDKYESFSGKEHLCELKNESPYDLQSLGLVGLYYGADGKIISITPKDQKIAYEHFTYSGGSTLKAGASQELACGWGKDVEPAGATFEVQVTGWGFREPLELRFKFDTGGKMYKERPLGGFK